MQIDRKPLVTFLLAGLWKRVRASVHSASGTFRTQTPLLGIAALGLLLTTGVTPAKSQTPGQIFQPASGMGRLILNPSGSGFVSANGVAFPTTGIDYGSASEIPYHPLPVLFAEIKNDTRTGGSHTDLIGITGNDPGAFVYNDGVNLLFRQRLLNHSTSSKGYGFLFDTTLNGQVDFEVVLRTGGGQAGITIYDGAGNVIRPLLPLSGNLQKAVAAAVGGDQTFFYDWFVPWSVMPFGPDQQFRAIAFTLTSAVGGYKSGGTIADIAGLDDRQFPNQDLAVLFALQAQPLTSGSGLSDGGGFAPPQTSAPTINGPVREGSNVVVSGASGEAAGTLITLGVYASSSASTASSTTTATVGGSGEWSATVPSLSAGEFVGATATATGKTASSESTRVRVLAASEAEDSGPAVPVCTPAPTNFARLNANAFTGVVPSLPSSLAQSRLVIRLYAVSLEGRGSLVHSTSGADAVNTVAFSRSGSSEAFAQDNISGDVRFTLGNGSIQNAYPSGTSFYVTAEIAPSTLNGSDGLCESDIGFDGAASRPNAPVISTQQLAAGTGQTISGTSDAGNGSSITVYKNDDSGDIGTGTVQSGAWSLPITGSIANGDVVYARVSVSNVSSPQSNSITVGSIQTAPPVITGQYTTSSTTVTGYTLGGWQDVRVFLGNTPLGSTTSNSFGSWSLGSLTLSQGPLTADAQASGEARSAASAPVTVSASSPPAAPTVDGPIEAGQTTISATRTDGNVQFFADGELIGSANSVNSAASIILNDADAALFILQGVSITATNSSGELTSSPSAPEIVVPSATVAGISLFASPASPLVGDSARVTATVTDRFGAPLAGQTVLFEVSGPGVLRGSLSDQTTNSFGQASIWYVTGGSAGTAEVRGSVGSEQGAVTIQSVSGNASQISTLSIANGTISVGGTTTATATVLTSGGDPVPGVRVLFTSSDPNIANVESSAFTDGAGQATVLVSGANQAGSVTIQAAISATASNVDTSDTDTVSLTVANLTATQLAITQVSPATPTRGVPTTSITVELQDASGNPVPAAANIQLTLTSNLGFEQLISGTPSPTPGGVLLAGTSSLTIGNLRFTASTRDGNGVYQPTASFTVAGPSLTAGSSASFAVNDGVFWRPAATGNWTTAAWETSSDGAVSWQSGPAIVPTALAAGEIVLIPSGIQTTLDANISVHNLVIEGTLDIPASRTLRLEHSAYDVTAEGIRVEGTLRNSGGSFINDDPSSPIVFAGGTYEHARNGGAIPIATWQSRPGASAGDPDVVSTLKVSGLTNTALTAGLNQVFQQIVWDNQNQTVDQQLHGNTSITDLLDLRRGTLSIGAHTLTAGGTLQHGSSQGWLRGTTASTLVVMGTGSIQFDQASSGIHQTVGSLELDHTGGGQLALASNLSIESGLTLTNGVLAVTGSNNELRYRGAGAITRTNGFVTGPLRRVFVAEAVTPSFTFPIGSGPAFAPVTLEFTAGTIPAGESIVAETEVEAATDIGKRPPGAGFRSNREAGRYWTVEPSSSLSSIVYDIDLEFPESERDSLTLNRLEVRKLSRGNNQNQWKAPRGLDRRAADPATGNRNGLKATGFTDFSEFYLGEVPGALASFEITETNGSALGGKTAGQSFDIRIQALDAQGEVAENFTGSVTLTSSGVLAGSPVTTAPFTAGVLASESVTITSAGSFTLTATDATTQVTSTSSTFTVTAGAADAGTSAVTADPTSIEADGTSTTSITVQLKDANGNNLTAGGSAVTMSTTSGSLSSVTDEGDGTYTATLTSSTTAGTATVGAKLGSDDLTPATVTFVPGAADAATSTLTASPTTGLVADGTASSTLTFTVLDTNSNPVEGQTVFFAVTAGTGAALSAGPWTTSATGVATATLTSTTAGDITVTGYLGADATGAVAGTATVTFSAGPAATIAAQAGDSQSALVGTAVATAPSVIVTDINGNPVSGVSVTFAVTAGGGTIDPTAAVTTGADGIAALTSWTLGAAAGANALTATVTGSNPAITTTVTATATASAPDPSKSTLTASTTSGVVADGTASSTLTFTALDASDGPVEGQAVFFEVTSGTGTLSTPPQGGWVTDASGVVTATLTSTTAGDITVTGYLGADATGMAVGTATITFVPGAADATTSTLTASATTGLVADGTATSTLTFTALDANSNPVAGQAVFFAVTSGTGTLSAAPQGGWITDASGVVTATLTSTTAGDITVTGYLGADATGAVAGTATVTFSAGPAATIAVQAGDAQSALVGTAVATAPSVLVTDANGNPVSGVSVTFAVTAGSGTVDPSTAVTTGANGIAALTSWTLGTAAGANTLTATVTGSNPAITTAITATATAGAADATTSTLTASATAGLVADGTASSTLTFTALDANSNPVAGQSVFFAVTSGTGGVLSSGPWTTNGSGVATATLTSTTADTITVTGYLGADATGAVAGTATVTFSAGPAATIAVQAGDTQSALVGTAVATAPSVLVTDATGNPVSGVSVTFAVTAGGGTIDPTTAVTTDANGIAALTSWTLGAAAGANTLTATLTGSNPAITTTVTATATAPPTVATIATAPLSLLAEPAEDAAEISWQVPNSDGDSPITDYRIELSTDKGQTWTLVQRPPSTATTVRIEPLTSYLAVQFRVAAINAIGVGPWSDVSEPVVPASPGIDESGNRPVPAPGEVIVLEDGVPVVLQQETIEGTWTIQIRNEAGDFATAVGALDQGGNPVPFSNVGAKASMVLVRNESVSVNGGGFLPGSSVAVWLFSSPILLGNIEVQSDGDFAGVLPVPGNVDVGLHTLQITGRTADLSLRSISVGVLVADRVSLEPPTGLTYPSSQNPTPLYGEGGATAGPTLASDGGAPPIYQISAPTPVPTGIAIDPMTGVISWDGTLAAGSYPLTVTASNPGGSVSANLTLEILPRPVSGLTLEPLEPIAFTGAPLTPPVTLKDGDRTLTLGTDFTVTYADNVNVGTATLTLTGAGNYTGSRSATFSIVGDTPSAPRGLTGEAGDDAVTLQWLPPLSEGTAAVTGYEVQVQVQVQVQEGDQGTWQTAGQFTELEATIEGLENDRRHRFRVRALSAVGEGAFTSPALELVPRAPMPEAEGTLPALEPGEAWEIVDGTPRPLILEVVEGTRLQLSNGDFILGVEGRDADGNPISIPQANPVIRLKPDGFVRVEGSGFQPGSLAAVWIFSDPILLGHLDVTDETTFDGNLPLPPGLELGPHTIQVVGRDQQGARRAANLGVILEADAEFPSAPGSVTGEAGDGSVTLTWVAPASDGGSPITGYLIEVQVHGGSWMTMGPFAGSPVTLTDLTNGKPHRFRVAAVNERGVGPYASPIVELTPEGPVTGSGGRLPELDPGEAIELVDDEVQPLVVVIEDSSRLKAGNGDLGLTFEAEDASGNPIQIEGAAPILRLVNGGRVALGGTGFAPGTQITLWIYPGLTALGSVTVNSSGQFAATFALAEGLAPGSYTLQVTGTDAEGRRRATVLGFVVEGDEDLRVRVTSSSALPQLGETITLTVEVTNAGSLAARDVEVDPALDLRRLEILSAVASQGSVGANSSLWSIGRLEPSQTVTLTIRARVIQPDLEEAR